MFKQVGLIYILAINIIIGVIAFFTLNFRTALANQAVTTNKSSDIQTFYLVIGIVGGCIFLTLLYVSWRKYKDAHKKDNKNSPNS